MAEDKKTTGFVTQSQAQSGGVGVAGGEGSPTPITTNDPELKPAVKEINKAIAQYDKFIKEQIQNIVENYDKGLQKYLDEEYLYKDISVVAITDAIRTYMGQTGFTDRKITDTPTDAFSIINRNFVATTTEPSNPVVGQMYFSGGKQQFWNGSAWVTWT